LPLLLPGVPAYRFRFQVPVHASIIQRGFRIPREAIYHQTMKELSTLFGQIEMDETRFGGKVRGKRGQGGAGEHIIFALCQRNGKLIGLLHRP